MEGSADVMTQANETWNITCRLAVIRFTPTPTAEVWQMQTSVEKDMRLSCRDILVTTETEAHSELTKYS